MPSAPSVAVLGFPRIGPQRELKFAVERHWAGLLGEPELLEHAAALRAATWARLSSLGATVIPSNDFSFYDQVLDTSAMLGAVPDRYGWDGGSLPLSTYFAMARGVPRADSDPGVAAAEMTKWFDTNYHYLVPELSSTQTFALSSTKVLDEHAEATALGIDTRPVLVGPVTYLLLSKTTDGSDPLALLPGVLEVYAEVLNRLADQGATWVQIDEPCLVTDLDHDARAAYTKAYRYLAEHAAGIDVMLTTYFGPLGDNADLALSLPVAGLHLDLVRGAGQLDDIAARTRPEQVLSLGVVDGRNIWRNDLRRTLDRVAGAAEARGAERVQLAPSCSLLHVPIDRELETSLHPIEADALAFAVQKVAELATLARGVGEGADAVAAELSGADVALARRAESPATRDPQVRTRTVEATAELTRRTSPFEQRREAQRARFGLPPLPTTTIGSFPQTADVRKARAEHAKGRLDDAGYDAFLEKATRDAVRWQEQIGIDVLVHGEFERNDMVQYFGEQLDGYLFTENGWVQSYGSRCVRPPIISGDVSRPQPMTVRWSRFAQSLTDRPMKGMLTGPVTMLQWSFVRDDLPRSEVAVQIALALRDEVTDLEAAGIGIIQIDEPALREGLPLRRGDRPAYLRWAVDAFRLASAGVGDETQIHTHMCYSEFNDIIESIAELDADVISIETARSHLELLDAFTTFRYPSEIGPGVYDIHAPRVPTVDEIVDLLGKATAALSPEQIWVNPDCGLKTRRWEEVRPALVNMVEAARTVRATL